MSVGRNVQRLESEDIFTNNLSTSARQLSNNKNPMQYNDKLYQISIGVWIGDCSIQKNRSRCEEKYRLFFLQGKKHKEYVYHLHQEFKDYVISQPFYDEKRSNYSFQIVFHAQLYQLPSLFCNKEYKKTISSYFTENKISPISLPYWFKGSFIIQQRLS